MKRPYLTGLGVAVAAAIVTIAVKSAFTKYPGVGDFLVFYYFGEMLPPVWAGYGRIVLYVAKILCSVGIFSAFYIGLKRFPRFRFPIAVGLTVAALVAMSFGEAVVG